MPGALCLGRKGRAIPCRNLESPRGQHVSSPTAATALDSAPGRARDGTRNLKTTAGTCLSPARLVQSMPARTGQISEYRDPDPVANPCHREYHYSPGQGLSTKQKQRSPGLLLSLPTHQGAPAHEAATGAGQRLQDAPHHPGHHCHQLSPPVPTRPQSQAAGWGVRSCCG